MNNIDPLIPFGKNLRKIRTELKISQEKLAEKAELDRTFISILEAGKKNPSLRSIFKLARALDVDPKCLLDF